MKSLIKNIINSFPARARRSLFRLLFAGFSNEEKLSLGLTNLSIALIRLKKIGYNPKHVIDVGAHNGDWTKEVSKIYPNSIYFLVEALPQKADILKLHFKNPQYKLYNCLVGDANKKDITFYSMDTGSSVMEEMTVFPRESITLDMYTLDSLIDSSNLEAGVFLKIDVQGFELFVIKGAVEILKKVELLCLEVSLLNYNENAPLIDEIIIALKDYGFVALDIIGFFRKSTDGALIQTDMLFIKQDSVTRKKINNLKEPFTVVIQ